MPLNKETKPNQTDKKIKSNRLDIVVKDYKEKHTF